MENKIFDREEMMRLSNEGMETSMRFFLTINENIIKMGEWQMNTMNENNKKAMETINKAYDEYQKHSRVVMSRFENVWKETIQKITPYENAAGSPK